MNFGLLASLSVKSALRDENCMHSLSKLTRQVVHIDADKVHRRLATEIKVFWLELHEEHRDVKPRHRYCVDVCYGVGDGGFVAGRVEAFGNVESVERHDCGRTEELVVC